MKIAVITDVHSNLPALQAALKTIQADGVDAIYHTGDVFGIGPFPAETLDLLLSTPRLRCVMGNHDKWFAESVDGPINDDAAYETWHHERVDPALRATVGAWPYEIIEHFDGVSAGFTHFALDQTGRDWITEWTSSSAGFDTAFGSASTDVVFFGHVHVPSDAMGRRRYVNPGALGISVKPLARYALMTVHGRQMTVEHRAAPYDWSTLIDAFESRNVPNRHWILPAYFGV